MILKIKSIPKMITSIKSPTNFKPSLKTLSYLCLGLIFFGFGEGLLIVSGIFAISLISSISAKADFVAFFVSFDKKDITSSEDLAILVLLLLL